jgi:hypothetical protein
MAREHLENSAPTPNLNEESDRRWDLFVSQIRSDVGHLHTVSEVIDYAQTRIDFEHRVYRGALYPALDVALALLRSEFPSYGRLIDSIGDSGYSRRVSLIKMGHRILSSATLFQLRYLLFCLQHASFPKRVCEIGGGYGALARLFFCNPIHCPDTYVMIDFPESLFFAEVFLRANFPNLEIAYATRTARSDASVLLCPIGHAPLVSHFTYDLTINTGSMGEMSNTWVTHWMDWLDSTSCRYFYSLNYFGQPIDFSAERRNDWSPRPSAKWAARILRFDPEFVRFWSPERHWAEVLYERRNAPAPVVNWGRRADGQYLLESFDALRYGMPEAEQWALLNQCLDEMPSAPTEAAYLARQLVGSPTYGTRAGQIYEKLETKRTIVIPGEGRSPKA